MRGFIKSAVVLAGICLSVSGASAAEIKIGFPGPVTGPVQFLGQHMKWGAELAIEEINEKGGVLGQKLSFIMEDSKCAAPEAVAGTEKMLSRDGVSVLMGDICSSATLAMMPIVERAKIPLLVTISTHPGVTEKAGVGGNPWVFRTNPQDDALAIAMGKYLAEKKPYKKVAYFAEDTDYGRAGVVAMQKELEPKGIKTQSVDYFKKGESDYVTYLTKVKGAEPDAILLFMLDQELQNFMRQYRQYGLKIPITGRPALVSALVKDLIASGAFDGSSTIYPYYAGYENAPNKAFVEKYTKKDGQKPHYVGFEMYEGVKLMAQAIKDAGSTKPEAIQAALKKAKGESILGTIQFDDHHQAHNRALILEVKKGRLEVVELPST